LGFSYKWCEAFRVEVVGRGSWVVGEGDGAAVEDGEDVGVLEARGEADLARKALGPDDGIEMKAQDLEGDGAVVLEVGGKVDGGHATLADLALDAVPVGEGGREPFEVGQAVCAEEFRTASAGRCARPGW
jgi:hypothetical protein